MQKISAQNDSRPQKNSPEAKGYEGVQTFIRVVDGYLTTEQPKREYTLCWNKFCHRAISMPLTNK